MTNDEIKYSDIIANRIVTIFWNAREVSNKKLQMFFKKITLNQNSDKYGLRVFRRQWRANTLMLAHT